MHDFLQAKINPRLGFEALEKIIRRRNYGVLSTISRDGRPHSASVLFAVSKTSHVFCLYIITDQRTKKAGNIARNPNVSFVIPIPRRVGIIPPASIQFQGIAEFHPLDDEDSLEAYNSSVVLRRVLKLQLAEKKEVSTFIRIRPDPVIFTYGLGITMTRFLRHIEGANARVEIPASRLSERWLST